MDIVNDIESFSEKASKVDCLDELSGKLANCDGIFCIGGAAAFGAGCLEAASGNKSEFCQENLQYQSVNPEGSWMKKYCNEYTLDSERCEVVLDTVTLYCANLNPSGE